jgi:hypothetical protein
VECVGRRAPFRVVWTGSKATTMEGNAGPQCLAEDADIWKLAERCCTGKTRLVNDVVRGNLDIAQKMLTAKPDKDMQARLQKMLSDCDKADKKKV